MTAGPGKYDHLATLVFDRARAEGAVVIIIGGMLGSGFSVQATASITMGLPKLLRHMANEIEGDMARGVQRDR